MRTPVPCAKCESPDIVRVPAVKGGYGAGNFILFGLWSSKRVPVSRYLCGGCGFIEEWVDDPGDIARVKEKFSERWPTRPR